jgi:hypothetical protein
MNIFKDMVETSMDALKKTISITARNPVMLLLGPMVFIGISVAGMLLGNLGIIGSIGYFLVQAILFSAFLYYIEAIGRGRRFSFDDINYASRVYLSKVMGVMFIIYLVNILLGLVGNLFSAIGGPLVSLIVFAVYASEFIVLSAVPETIYRKSLSEMETIMESIRFLRENHIVWLFPNILAVLAAFGIFYSLSGLLSISSLGGIAAIILSIGLGPFMTMRGLLYQTLSTTSMRKRFFMRNNR